MPIGRACSADLSSSAHCRPQADDCGRCIASRCGVAITRGFTSSKAGGLSSRIARGLAGCVSGGLARRFTISRRPDCATDRTADADRESEGLNRQPDQHGIRTVV